MVDKNRIIGSAKVAKGTVKQVIGKVIGEDLRTCPAAVQHLQQG